MVLETFNESPKNKLNFAKFMDDLNDNANLIIKPSTMFEPPKEEIKEQPKDVVK
jgi:hypothetical protein